mmetsp:Transcript_25893/g.33807  ORF Transcript_25893/g.33807 Transcript_25893/m.33807 type:complete len:215 (+) Transcript_25893:13-657(+)
MSEKKDNAQNNNRLSDIVRKARVSSAERQDVVVDMKEADKARLELLAEKLEPIFNDIDKEDDRFDFNISSGAQPRIWIDSVAHVHMGRDRRTYRFVRDSRLGRVVLIESGDADEVYTYVTNYIADRVIEREKLLEGDMEAFKDYYARMTNENLGSDVATLNDNSEAAEALVSEKREPSSSSFVIGVTWFILGGLLSLALTFNYREELANFLQSF